VTRAEGLVGLRSGQDDDVVKRWSNGFDYGAQDGGCSERMGAPCFDEK